MGSRSRMTACVRADQLMYARQSEWSGLLSFDRRKLRDLIAKEIREYAAEEVDAKREDVEELIQAADNMALSVEQGWGSAYREKAKDLRAALARVRGEG